MHDKLYRNWIKSRRIGVLTKEAAHCYNIWEHTFTIEELEQDLKKTGFTALEFYGDAAGSTFTKDCDTVCVAARR